MENEKDPVLDLLNGKKPIEEIAESEEVIKEDKEEKVPYHKDPKVQRYVQKEIEKALGKTTEKEKFIQETKDDEDDFWERAIGNDTPEKVSLLKEAKARETRMFEKLAEESRQAQVEARQEAEREEAEALEELNQGFEDIEENFNVDLTSNTSSAKKLREEFVDYITKIAPKDKDGEVLAFPDLEASFEEFKARKQPTNSRAKDLANRSIDRSNDATIAPKEAEDNSWKAVDSWFAKLKKK